MQPLKIKANLAYLGFLLALCIAAAGGCVAFIVFYKSMQVLMAVCGVLLLIGAAFLCWTMSFCVELTEKSIRISAFTKTLLQAEEIESMQFSFFEGKNGVGYIYFGNGNSVVLPKQLFAPALKPALRAWAEQNGVLFKESTDAN